MGAFVRKYAADGRELWTHQFGTQIFASANGVAADFSGSVYVAGQVDGALPGHTNAGHNDAFLRRYDAGGHELWTRQFGTEGGDFATGVAVDSAGNIYVGGWSREEIERPGAAQRPGYFPLRTQVQPLGLRTMDPPAGHPRYHSGHRHHRRPGG